jgi:predicted murein hydrolase (TIGR00659 family)
MNAAAAWLMDSPLMGLSATLTIYALAYRLWVACKMNPLCHPVFISVGTLATLLTATGIPYAAYFNGAQVIHLLLGPATVALAIPLYRQLAALRRSLGTIGIALAIGCLTGIASATQIALWLGAAPQIALSFAPKSATTPIAIGISQEIGGIPSMTAGLVVITGLLGAAFGPRLLDLLGIKDRRARGLAMGVAAHGIGTAQALQSSEEEGAFAGMGMGLNGLATALVIPLIIRFLMN